MRDVDRVAVQRFVDWLTSLPGRNGRLCDRSVANALTPLRAALDAAVAEGLLQQNRADAVVLQRFGTSAETTPLMEMRRSARRYRASCGSSRAGVPCAGGDERSHRGSGQSPGELDARHGGRSECCGAANRMRRAGREELPLAAAGLRSLRDDFRGRSVALADWALKGRR
jgi:hypothetical protein